MAEGIMKCVKYLLFAFNLLFVISGILMIAGCVAVMTKYREIFASFGEMIDSVAVVMIIIGSIIIVISFLGCCGAFRGNYCLIVTFSAFLVLILLLEVGCLVAGLVLKSKLKTVIEDHLMSDLKQYGLSDAVTISWDIRQRDWQCCGVSNYTNWIDSVHLNASVPTSCCLQVEPACNATGLALASEDYAMDLIFTYGCLESVKDWALTNVGTFLSIVVGLTILQIVGIILASCLARSMRNELGIV